jgi:hypothetical protein
MRKKLLKNLIVSEGEVVAMQNNVKLIELSLHTTPLDDVYGRMKSSTRWLVHSTYDLLSGLIFTLGPIAAMNTASYLYAASLVQLHRSPVWQI